MIQFNLLPDVKLDYIKAQRSRRLIFSVSVLVSGAAIVLLVLLLSYSALQKKHINDLSHDISSESSQLQNKPQINKILTVQNQLESLTSLHDQKPAVDRLFNYLNQLTPAQISITDFHIDFVAHSATFTGTADALSTVNKFVDTLKFTTYTSSAVDANSASAATTTTTNDTSGNGTPAFTNVVLSSFALGNSGGQNGQSNSQTTYSISFAFDPTIFDITKNINLSIPNLVTTRSEIDKPSDLFTAKPQTNNTGGQ